MMKHLISTTAVVLVLGLAAPMVQAQEAASGTADKSDAAAEKPPLAGVSGGHGRVAFMANYDLDGDGSVTRADYFALRRDRFKTADINGDGVMEKAEYLIEFEDRLNKDYADQGRTRDKFYVGNIAQTMDRFDLLDLNKDGKMDESEYFAQAEKTFGRVDTNGDGVANADDPEPPRGPAVTDADFAGLDDFKGRVQASGPDQAPIYPGGEVQISGRGLVAGQKLTLQRGTVTLTREPVVVGDDGNFRASIVLPEDAIPGVYPVYVIGEGPDAVTTLDLKISPDIPLSGADAYPTTSVQGPAGLYQSAYSAASNAIFVTAASFGGPGGGKAASTLTKLSPDTLETIAQITIPESPDAGADAPAESGAMAKVAAVFGIAADDAHGNLWVTNTIQGTAAVYSQKDLSLVKQFDADLVRHSREVVIDAAHNRAYVSASASNEIGVFDTETLEYLDTIRITTKMRGGEFTTMGLALDPEKGRLFAVSRTSNELAEIDSANGEILRVLPIPGAKNATSVAFDAGSNRVLIASQQSDDLIALDLATAEVAFRTPVGAGALSVTVDGGLAYVANRGAGTVAVVDGTGALVANLPIGSYPNHVLADGKGHIFVVNKSKGAEDTTGDHLTRIR